MAINSNMRPAEMFQLRLLNQMGARRQRRSPTLFSSLADALRTAGTAYASGQITQGAQDRREAANKEAIAMLTGTPAVTGMVSRTRPESEAGDDVFGPDGLGMDPPEARPNNLNTRANQPWLDSPRGDQVRYDGLAPNFQGVGDTMPSLTEMVPGITTPAVSATPEQLMAVALGQDTDQNIRQLAMSRYASAIKPETFNLQFSPDGTPFVTGSKTGIRQLPGNFGKLTSTEEKYNMLINAGIPPKEAMKLAAIGRPPRPLAAPNTQISLTGEQFKKRFPEAARGVTGRNLKTMYAITLNPNGTIANIRSEDKDFRMASDGNVLSVDDAFNRQQDFTNYTPRDVGPFKVPLPVDEKKNNVENMSPVDPQGVQGVSRPFVKFGNFVSELFGNQTEGRTAENLLERTNATAVQIGASLPPSIANTKSGARLTNLVRDLEMKKVPTFSTFSSDETFVSEVRSYMNKLNRVRKEVTGVARSPVGSVGQQQAVQYIEAITDLMQDYAYLIRNSEGEDNEVIGAASAVIAKQRKAAESGASK